MEMAGQRCRGHTYKKRKSNGVLTPRIFQYLIWFSCAAAFDFRSIFSKKIKETGVETVAKDGSNRGGARPGAGRKPKALTEKINEGRSAEVLMEPAELVGMEVPDRKSVV